MASNKPISGFFKYKLEKIIYFFETERGGERKREKSSYFYFVYILSKMNHVLFQFK